MPMRNTVFTPFLWAFFLYLLVAYQINQSAEFDGRFGVTIAVNGLPLVQIKLKKNGISVDKAFGHKKGFRDKMQKK